MAPPVHKHMYCFVVGDLALPGRCACWLAPSDKENHNAPLCAAREPLRCRQGALQLGFDSHCSRISPAHTKNEREEIRAHTIARCSDHGPTCAHESLACTRTEYVYCTIRSYASDCAPNAQTFQNYAPLSLHALTTVIHQICYVLSSPSLVANDAICMQASMTPRLVCVELTGQGESARTTRNGALRGPQHSFLCHF
jgi:hypothetical protein